MQSGSWVYMRFALAAAGGRDTTPADQTLPDTMLHLSQALQEAQEQKEEALKDLGRANEQIMALEQQLERSSSFQVKQQEFSEAANRIGDHA